MNGIGHAKHYNSDVFLYTGTDLEPWTESIITSVENNSKIIDISNGIDLLKIDDFEEKHINQINILNQKKGEDYIEDSNLENANAHEHEELYYKELEHEDIHYDELEHEYSKNHNNYNHDNHHHGHAEIYDGHIWLNPQNAVKMIDNILEVIVEIDPSNKKYYINNAESYKKEILDLDSELENLVNNSAKREIAVGGEFAYAYLVDRYDIEFVSVYNNCGDGEDPSIAKVKSVIDYMNANKMKIVYYEELTEGTVAKMIAEETGAQSLVLYSIHNADINKDTYVSLFKKNIENLKSSLK